MGKVVRATVGTISNQPFRTPWLTHTFNTTRADQRKTIFSFYENGIIIADHNMD